MAQEKWSIDEKLALALAALQKEASIVELCRRHGVTETTFYRWRSGSSMTSLAKHPARLAHWKRLAVPFAIALCALT